MAETIFADRITNLYIQGGIVRLELAVMDAAPRKKGEQARLRVSHHVVLPTEAFAQAFGLQQAAMQKLVESGVLKKREDAPATPTETVA
jgi:hypothetical protein